MKTIVLSLIVLVAVTATASAKIDPAKYSFPKGYELVIKEQFYAGNSINYALSQIFKDSKEVKATAKGIQFPYYSVRVGADGNPIRVDATPQVGDRVLELNGVYWFNVETGMLIIKDTIAQPAPYAYANRSTAGVQKPKRERNGNGQGLAVAMGVLQQVAPRVLGGIGQGRGWGGDIYSPQPSGVLTAEIGLGRW